MPENQSYWKWKKRFHVFTFCDYMDLRWQLHSCYHLPEEISLVAHWIEWVPVPGAGVENLLPLPEIESQASSPYATNSINGIGGFHGHKSYEYYFPDCVTAHSYRWLSTFRSHMLPSCTVWFPAKFLYAPTRLYDFADWKIRVWNHFSSAVTSRRNAYIPAQNIWLNVNNLLVEVCGHNSVIRPFKVNGKLPFSYDRPPAFFFQFLSLISFPPLSRISSCCPLYHHSSVSFLFSFWAFVSFPSFNPISKDQAMLRVT